MNLPSPDIARLSKFILLLGSDQDGERAAAAKKATEFLKERSLDWHDVVAALDRKTPHPEDRDWRDIATFCLGTKYPWRAIERSFLLSMVRARLTPSEKQWKWLHDLESNARDFEENVK